MTIPAIINNIEYLMISKLDKHDIWICLNGMENHDDFKIRRSYREKLEKILNMSEIEAKDK